MGGGCPGRTVENPVDKTPGERRLLAKVRIVYDVWSIRTIGPRVFLGVGHDPDVYEKGGIELGSGGSRDGGKILSLELDGRDMTEIVRARVKWIERGIKQTG